MGQEGIATKSKEIEVGTERCETSTRDVGFAAREMAYQALTSPTAVCLHQAVYVDPTR